MLEIFSNFCLDFIYLLGLLGMEGNEIFFFFFLGGEESDFSWYRRKELYLLKKLLGIPYQLNNNILECYIKTLLYLRVW